VTYGRAFIFLGAGMSHLTSRPKLKGVSDRSKETPNRLRHDEEKREEKRRRKKRGKRG